MPLRWRSMLLGKDHEHTLHEPVMNQNHQSCNGQSQALRPGKFVDAQQMEASTRKLSALFSQERRLTHRRSDAPPHGRPPSPKGPRCQGERSRLLPHMIKPRVPMEPNAQTEGAQNSASRPKDQSSGDKHGKGKVSIGKVAPKAPGSLCQNQSTHLVENFLPAGLVPVTTNPGQSPPPAP